MVNMGELFAHSRIHDLPMERVPLSESEARAYLLEPGDLLFARQSLVLSGAGKCSVFLGASEPVTYEGHIIRARLDKGTADPLFYYYLFASRIGRDAIESIVEQVAAAGIRGSDLARLKVPYPPLAEQRAIAHILGSLDDKIELNRRMNETLEAMAQAIFKSWFVDFDPVRAKAEGRQPIGMDAATAALFPESFEASVLREIPRAWRVGTLGEVAVVNELSITAGYPRGTIEYVDISSVATGVPTGTTTYRIGDAPSRARRLVRHGDTIWSCVRPNRRSYLFISNPVPNLVVSTGFAVLTPNAVPPGYLYAWVTTDEFVDYLAARADGSAYPAVRPDDFASAEVLIPPGPILARFEGCVGPMRERIAHNERESRTLAAIRDALLPKLMSGEIEVADVTDAMEVSS
jgi:type I restriction enzyme S subunit